MSRRTELVLVTLVLLLGAGLRIYRLDDIPPGWRDDEIVETTVHAQRVLDGQLPLYFPEAEGHEPLYHYLSAGLIALAGQSLFVVRLLSAFFGVFSLAALYRLARRLFGPTTALLATLALSVSFWSLIYSRFKIRHIGEVGFMLLAFFFSIPGPKRSHPHTLTLIHSVTVSRRHHIKALLAGVFLSLCLYTYFAARVVPVILLAFVAYLALFHRETFHAHWRNSGLTALATALLVAPLAWALARVPGGEARLSIVGQPLQALLHGDFSTVLRNTGLTLGMFAFTGDPEYLYNIPGRPLFEVVGAALFLAGLLLCLWRWRQPRHAFLLIWFFGGIAPAFVSTPAASLGHTIVAQPVVYLFPAMALVSANQALRAFAAKPTPLLSVPFALFAVNALPVVASGAFLGLTAARDLRDYFVRWPALPEVRYLYRADLHDAAPALRALPPGSGLALSSRDLHQADVTALQLETPGLDLHARLFDPARAWLFPDRLAPVLLRESAPAADEFSSPPLAGSFAIRSSVDIGARAPAVTLSASFGNGLTCLGYSLARDPASATVSLYTVWRADSTFVPPPARPLGNIAGTPIPLRIFSHLLSLDGSHVAGSDHLDVDPATLRAGDQFIQRLQIALPPDATPGSYTLSIGLYHPVTGERVLRTTGEDHLTLTPLELP